MSERQVTEEQAKAAQDVLTRFHRQGTEDGAVGAMHDGCKRARDKEDWIEVNYDESFTFERPSETATTSKQEPVPPTKGPQKVVLPTGVSSMEDWGTTICRLPKVADLDASYEELVNMPEKYEYLKWVFDHGQDRGGRFEDFAKYLAAVDFPKIMAKNNPRFGTSKNIRERKPKK